MMRRPISMLLLILVALAPTLVASLGKKPVPIPQEIEEVPVLDAPLKEKAICLLAGSVAASITDFIVHKFVNETQRLDLKHEKGKYTRTLLYAAAESIDVGAKAYGLTVATDIASNLFPLLKNLLPFQANLHQVAPQIALLVWGIKSISSIKYFILNKLVYGRRLGKVALFNRLADIFLALGGGYNILNILQYDMGVSISGFFAASGVSALIISLASKDMVEQMVGGLLLQAWDAVEIGEKVRLGDGTEGKVVRIGLLETEVEGSDHVPIRVPNSQIVGKRVHMFSKVSKSKIKQTLRFKYSDLQKMHKLLEDIHDEIQKACNEKMLGEPEVLLTNYEADHIQVTVSASFDFKPDSADYDQTKQRALFAIADAVNKNKVDFALPAIQYETKQGVQILQG